VALAGEDHAVAALIGPDCGSTNCRLSLDKQRRQCAGPLSVGPVGPPAYGPRFPPRRHGAQQSSRRTRAGSLGPSPHATGAPASDFQEALGAAARLPLVLLAHRGLGKTSMALPLIGEDPEAGHGYEGKTGCE
jgi:hypothetical protein